MDICGSMQALEIFNEGGSGGVLASESEKQFVLSGGGVCVWDVPFAPQLAGPSGESGGWGLGSNPLLMFGIGCSSTMLLMS